MIIKGKTINVGNTIKVWDDYQGKYWKRVVLQDKNGKKYFNKGSKIFLNSDSIREYKIVKGIPVVHRK